jgi:hypothetical protein
MAFDSPAKIVLSTYAEFNLEHIISHYKSLSNKVAADFLIEFDNSLHSLSLVPSQKMIFDEYRGLLVKKFPYLIIYKYSEVNNTVFILTLFNTWNDPQGIQDVVNYFGI